MKLQLAAVLVAAFLSSPAIAQPLPNSRITGSAHAEGMPEHTIDVSFSCLGEPTCTGTYSAKFDEPGCHDSQVSGFQMTGLDLSVAGPVQGNVTFKNFDWTPISGCLPPPGAVYIDLTFAYTGTWNGTTGVFQFDYDDSPTLFRFTGSFKADRAASPPVFPMTVTSNINAVSAAASATIQYRPQDLGTTASVFVFAVAPLTVVKAMPGQKAHHYGHMSRGSPKDDPVPCVLAQLSSSGQLVGVSASSMQAYLTGVLTAGQQAVTILNGVPTVNIGGATFYVGYGQNSAAMLSGGTNRSAVTAPGSIECKPEPPKTGWYWNAAEDGRGYSIEVQGNHIFFAAFHYDISGRASWNFTTGVTSLDGSLFMGELGAARGGQTLTGQYPGYPAINSIGQFTLAFSDATHGTMIWPGGTVVLQRLPFIPNGLTALPQVGLPEAGWWWNASENGRGYFIEWQNGAAQIAGYMYDDVGNPVWYLAGALTPEPMAFNGTWWLYGNGQYMGGPHRRPTRVNDNVGPLTIQFHGPVTATMTLPGGRQLPLTRFRF